MSIKSYLKEWDFLSEDKEEKKKEEKKPYFEERKPIKGFKIGDLVKIVGLNKNTLVGTKKGGFIGKFGMITSMKNNGQPDGIIFFKKNGEEEDEADFAYKFIFEPAKKCKSCSFLFTNKELNRKGVCKHCAKAAH